LRGDKPWREEWVRRVIRGFRSMRDFSVRAAPADRVR
jgi:hypothetical protein